MKNYLIDTYRRSPGKWELIKRQSSNELFKVWTDQSNENKLEGRTIALVYEEKDAKLIVRAVNCHDRLLAALKYYHDDVSIEIHKKIMHECADCLLIKEAEGK